MPGHPIGASEAIGSALLISGKASDIREDVGKLRLQLWDFSRRVNNIIKYENLDYYEVQKYRSACDKADDALRLIDDSDNGAANKLIHLQIKYQYIPDRLMA